MGVEDSTTPTGLADDPPAWEPRAVTRARGLAELLARRPELAGVYLPADVTADAVRWSA